MKTANSNFYSDITCPLPLFPSGQECSFFLQQKKNTMTTKTVFQIQIQIESNNNYNGYRDSDLDLDLDSQRFSDLMTQLTITNTLRNLNHDIEGQ